LILSNPSLRSGPHQTSPLGRPPWPVQLAFISTEPLKENDRKITRNAEWVSVSVPSVLSFWIYVCSVSLFPVSKLLKFSAHIILHFPV
jgi:hypothetical protein